MVAEALGWLGTPYHHHGRIRGVGVDCAMLLAEVFQAVGMVEHLEPGHYAPDWHLHQGAELFAAWVERHGGMPVQTPAPGDVGLWRFGRTYSHGSIVVGADGALVHAYLRLGVVRGRPSEAPLAGRPVRWYTFWSD